MPESENGNARILIGLDGSRPSKSAAKSALQLAQNFGLSIHGIFIVDEAIIMGPYEYYKAELGIAETPASQAELVQWFEIFGEREIHWLENLCQTAQVPVTTSLLFGGVVESILENAVNSQFLILGRRGNNHSGDERHLGKYFQSIAHRVHIPILVGGKHPRYIEQVLLAYDGSPAARSALDWAARFQQAMHCRVSVVTANENSDSSPKLRNQVEEELRAVALEVRELTLGQSDAVEAILEAAENSQADLIMMGKYRHTRLRQRLFGSKVDRILHQAECPIWLA
jgi:nucleotide-binding universal stress UspA family protein